MEYKVIKQLCPKLKKYIIFKQFTYYIKNMFVK